MSDNQKKQFITNTLFRSNQDPQSHQGYNGYKGRINNLQPQVQMKNQDPLGTSFDPLLQTKFSDTPSSPDASEIKHGQWGFNPALPWFAPQMNPQITPMTQSKDIHVQAYTNPMVRKTMLDHHDNSQLRHTSGQLYGNSPLAGHYSAMPDSYTNNIYDSELIKNGLNPLQNPISNVLIHSAMPFHQHQMPVVSNSQKISMTENYKKGVFPQMNMLPQGMPASVHSNDQPPQLPSQQMLRDQYLQNGVPLGLNQNGGFGPLITGADPLRNGIYFDGGRQPQSEVDVDPQRREVFLNPTGSAANNNFQAIDDSQTKAESVYQQYINQVRGNQHPDPNQQPPTIIAKTEHNIDINVIQKEADSQEPTGHKDKFPTEVKSKDLLKAITFTTIAKHDKSESPMIKELETRKLSKNKVRFNVKNKFKEKDNVGRKEYNKPRGHSKRSFRFVQQ